jgi:hypothetical protein
MTLAPESSYQSSSGCIVVLFSLREPGAAEELHHARAAWQDRSDIEALDEDHFLLIVRASRARRATS